MDRRGRLSRGVLLAGMGVGRVFAVFAVSVVGAGLVVRHQARLARLAIGKPLGEDTPSADGVYKKRRGDPIDLLLLGDSIAAGLGAEHPEDTLGGQLAVRLAKATRRAVRLRTGAQVGAETSMVRAQLAGLPEGYRPDIAVVVVGGNDVTHRVRVQDSCGHLAAVVKALRDEGVDVVVGTCPDLSALRAVPQPLRTLGGLASRQLATAQRDVVLDLGARPAPRPGPACSRSIVLRRSPPFTRWSAARQR